MEEVSHKLLLATLVGKLQVALLVLLMEKRPWLALMRAWSGVC
jgi:hypothetical protein